MNKSYINKIVRKLKCSGKKKKEIRCQLTTELEEYGVDIDTKELIKRMGNPAEIAEEFNQNFSEDEKKKYRREKFLKIIAWVAVVLVALILLAYWALPKQTALENSKIFREDKVVEQAEYVIDLLDAENYDKLTEISDPVLKDYIQEEYLATAKEEVFDDWGKQVSIGKIYTAEVTQMGKKSAVIEVHVEYENTTVIYTLSFNEDMMLQGLFMK